MNRLIDTGNPAHLDFWKTKAEANGGLLATYEGSVAPDGLFAASNAHSERLREVVYTILPARLQAENAEADFHVVAWLTRIAATSGATGKADVTSALEKRFGAALPANVKTFLDKWTPKESWSKVYSAAIH